MNKARCARTARVPVQQLIAAWQAEASGEVADRLAALGDAVAGSQGQQDPDTLHTWRILHGIGEGMPDWPLRRDW